MLIVFLEQLSFVFSFVQPQPSAILIPQSHVVISISVCVYLCVSLCVISLSLCVSVPLCLPGPQAFPALLLLSTLAAATRVLLPLACLAASGPIDSSSFSFSGSPFTHTHTRARALQLAGPPPFLQPSSPSQSFKRRRRGWAED